jgi:hypothetical protein
MSDSHTNAITVVERHDARPLAPVVAAGMEMLRQNPSPEAFVATMDHLLAVQERHEANEARKAYAAAIVAVKRDLPSVIGYDAQNKFAGYKYSTLAAIVDAVTSKLSEHGLSVAWDASTQPPGTVTVTCRITHSAGHVEASSPMTSNTENTTTAAGKEKKTPVQAIMSTTTTLKRVTLMNMLGISSGEERTDEASERDEPAPDSVHVETNLKWVGWLKKQGRSVDEACKLVGGRKVDDWTRADLAKIKAWAAPEAKTETTREPGEEG